MSSETVPPPVAEEPKQAQPKRSAVEGIKANSRQLRGTIALELVRDTDHFADQDKQLLKFHGMYQQEDRDARKTRGKTGAGKQYQFMVRCKIPGGRLTAKQYLAMDDLAGQHANGTLRFTSRQGIQFHGVLKDHLKETIAGINACLLTTLGACGDVERNVMACPAPHHHDGVHAQLQETAQILAAQLAPRSRAYHEIWLNGHPVPVSGGVTHGAPPVGLGTTHHSPLTTHQDVEPLYGKVYLPRKFKTGLALPEDNCIDVYGQDLGLLAIVEEGTIAGYNVLVGGGMGMTHGNADTFPHLAQPICYVPASAVVIAAEAVVRLFRDHGNRADRKRARIKYLVHDWGVDKFRHELSEYMGGELQPPKPVKVTGFETHTGWHAQGDGKNYYGLSIENGRVKDEGTFRLRSALREMVERFQPDIRLTPLQDILLCDLEPGAKREIDRLLDEHGVSRPDQISNLQKLSMACPAVPTCGLALSESERVFPSLIDQLEREFKRLGLGNEKISVRMTGCPNGCARPYQSEVGIVGRSGDKYTLFVGGHVLGHRLNFVLRDLVPFAHIVPTLVPLLEQFTSDRLPGESFGDYCQRLGAEQLQSLLPSPAAPPRNSHEGPASRLAPAAKKEASLAGGNGAATAVSPAHSPALAEPDSREISLALPDPAVTAPPLPKGGQAGVRCETFLAGLPGEERPDYTCRYHTDGSVKDTVIYFYAGDQRAISSQPGDPLRREATYLGQVDPYRLHTARKLSDTFYVGAAGYELRDRRVEYRPGGEATQTIVYFYEGELRAKEVPSGAAVRREVVQEGELL